MQVIEADLFADTTIKTSYYINGDSMNAVVNIHEGIISWIKSIADPDAVASNAETLSKWEKGKKPTVAQVDRMSRCLDVPFGYFFLSEPCVYPEDSPAFRTLGSKKKNELSRNLRDTVSNMEIIQSWLREALSDDSYAKSPVSGILDEHDDVISASQKLRAILHLETDWYKKADKTNLYSCLRERAGKNQVFVFESGAAKQSLKFDEFRAFALYDDVAPLILINAADHDFSKAFSLLQELVHIALGQDNLIEGSHSGGKSFSASVASEIWGKENRFNICDRKAARKKECRDFSSRFDHNFLSLLHRSVHDGKTRYTEAYRMTGCWGKSFEELMLRL